MSVSSTSEIGPTLPTSATPSTAASNPPVPRSRCSRIEPLANGDRRAAELVDVSGRIGTHGPTQPRGTWITSRIARVSSTSNELRAGVNSHLRRAFEKLGVSTRAGLAAVVAADVTRRTVPGARVEVHLNE